MAAHHGSGLLDHASMVVDGRVRVKRENLWTFGRGGSPFAKARFRLALAPSLRLVPDGCGIELRFDRTSCGVLGI